MAKKPIETEAPAELEAPAPEPTPEPELDVPAGHVKIVLKDANENAIEGQFTVEADYRDRAYVTKTGTYACARQEDDGSWTYRLQTH